MCLNSVENDNGQNLNLKEIILQERMIKSMTVIIYLMYSLFLYLINEYITIEIIRLYILKITELLWS